MPCKLRVLWGRLQFDERTPESVKAWGETWQARQLPEFVGRVCASNEIRFLDATAALKREANAGRLPYNPVWDTHLNRLGHEVLAQVLAEGMTRSALDQTTAQGEK